MKLTLVLSAIALIVVCDSVSDEVIRKTLFDTISAQRIGENLKSLTERLLVGDLPLDDNTLLVYNTWKELGLKTSLSNYSVLLSFQDKDRPNYVTKFDTKGAVVHKSSPFEDPLNAPPEIAKYYKEDPVFLGYSPSTAQPLKATPVYVNYGRAEDFDYLDKIKVNVSGHIAVAKYGRGFRGNIVQNAHDHGAVAVLIYCDPLDYTDGNVTNTYPHSIYLPPSGVQRGTIKLADGDPLTPFYPAIDGSYRIPEVEANLPTIPAQPISYADAYHILQGLSGPAAPKEWVGGLNITYNVGPGYTDQSYLTLEVNTQRKMHTIYDVIGTIEGCKEPDRFVLVGNHRDAWTLGSVDPHSGTAAMLEMSRTFVETMKTEKWCPRRSIVFCSWGAEEYGVVGSLEWVEEHQNLLRQAIAYLNVDIAVNGNYTLQANAVPTLIEPLVSAMKSVDNPNQEEVKSGQKTVFDSFFSHRKSKLYKDLPDIQTPGSGSDQSPFLETSGVPVIEMSYESNEKLINFPLYHTMYETYDLLANLIDRGFHYTRALTQVWAEMARSLADTPLLPMVDSLRYYSLFLDNAMSDLANSEYRDILATNNITLGYLNDTIRAFGQEVANFLNKAKNLDLNDELKVRSVNDCVMSLERTFLDRSGMPSHPDWTHVILAPSALDSYDGSSFAKLYDLLFKYRHQSSEQTLNDIRKHISIINFHINSAKILLKQKFY